MKKRFVAKNRGKGIIIKLLAITFILYASLVVTFNVLLKNSISHLLEGTDLGEALFTKGTGNEKFFDVSLLNPSDLLKLGLNYSFKGEEISSPYEELRAIETHKNDDKPIVYIYNTHPNEYYDSTLLESYNIKYSVKMADYFLSDSLKELGIPSYVESGNHTETILKNTYETSRTFLDKRLKEYPSIEFVVDIHRDAVSKEESTVKIEEDSYAKVLFVVGLDHKDYEKKLALAEKLDSLLPEGVSRGISKKSGHDVNGIYNQDISKDAVLLEIGGKYNSIGEVKNTTELVAKAIFEYRNGR